ncbi:MAG TPA: tetratricopeptide repeat protein [Vicinamibacterales bacterium]
MLRKAEKLLRQGRLTGAIAEYERVVQAYPDDPATATALGDLYVRAGQSASAVAQFMRVGDHWLREGVYAKAAATYRKILKLDPAHESALLQLVEACAQQGQLADAKAHLRSAIERREARGDQDGADALTIRLSELDPDDFEARVAAAKIRVRTGKAPVDDLLQLAHELDQRGRAAEAESLLEDVVRRDPDNPGITAIRLRLTRSALQRGELERARSFLPDAKGSSDPDLLLIAGELLLRMGELDEGRAHLSSYVRLQPHAAGQLADLGDKLPSQAARYAVVDLLVEQAAATADYRKAARRLQAFLERSPRHVPALLRLVEVCVDGELDAALTSAQEELAEAYLETGEAEKAQVIAEDLLLRNPRSTVHRDRLRRILTTLGEKDPDAIIAERLLFVEDEELVGADASSAEDAPSGEAGSAIPTEEPVAVVAASSDEAEEVVEFEPVEFEAWEQPEVDLTTAVDQLSATAADAGPAAAALPPSPAPAEEPAREPAAEAATKDSAPSLDSVFGGLRARIARDSASLPPGDHAARNFRVGQTYANAGMVREAAEAFEKAAQDPRYRFRSAQALGRLYRKHGMVKEAVEWLDIASEAPAPKIDEHRAALYELAEALEEIGETTRALAVLLDLVAEQSDYRDARARIDRLSRVQA